MLASCMTSMNAAQGFSLSYGMLLPPLGFGIGKLVIRDDINIALDSAQVGQPGLNRSKSSTVITFLMEQQIIFR